MIVLKQALLNGFFYWSFRAAGLMPTVRRVLGTRGVIVMFHEVQERASRELMTAADVAFSYSNASLVEE